MKKSLKLLAALVFAGSVFTAAVAEEQKDLNVEEESQVEEVYKVEVPTEEVETIKDNQE